MLILVVFCLLLPIASGYGATIDLAETISPGTHSLILYASHDDAYYKISCPSGQNLSVSLSYSYPTFDLNLLLYDPSQTQVDVSSEFDPPDEVEFINTTNGFYYIRVARFTGDENADFTLTITLTGTNGVPGFDVLLIIYGLLVTLGLVFYLRSHRFTAH